MEAFGPLICDVPSPVCVEYRYKLVVLRRRGAQEIIWCTYPRSVTLSVFTDVSLQSEDPLDNAAVLLEPTAVIRSDVRQGCASAGFHWRVPHLGSVHISLVDNSEIYLVIAAAAPAQFGLGYPPSHGKPSSRVNLPKGIGCVLCLPLTAP